jgi:hypothetical protein
VEPFDECLSRKLIGPRIDGALVKFYIASLAVD